MHIKDKVPHNSNESTLAVITVLQFGYLDPAVELQKQLQEPRTINLNKAWAQEAILQGFSTVAPK